jgi:sugar phosphate permease
MVADYFPDKRRALAMGIFMAAISLGGVLGIVVGAQLEAVYGWRLTFVAVGLPGFGAALLAGNLRDPSRIAISLALREFLQELELGVNSLIRRCLPIILATAFGSIAAYVLDKRFGASSALDTAAFALILGLGLAINIRLWVRQARAAPAHPASPATVVEAAAGEIVRGVRAVLRTPTLVYIFVGGALISFGMNGLVGWAPTFTSRELGLSVAEVSVRLGKWGLIFGIAGTLTGGWVADWLRKYTGAGRIITVALGFAIGGPLAVWLLTVRDIDTFGTVFCAAFFFLTWYNGPLTALIFDVVPSNIGGTVVGAYLLFIHLAGDTISFPLVGALSDRFGIDRAVFVLPVMATLGGLVVLGAIRTLTVDADRAHLATAEWEIRVIGRS